MVPDLQTPEDGGLVELDPKGAIDVNLYWQQWRLSSLVLERVAARVRAQAEPGAGAPPRLVAESFAKIDTQSGLLALPNMEYYAARRGSGWEPLAIPLSRGRPERPSAIQRRSRVYV